MTVANFSAGPGVLYPAVLKQVQDELTNFQGSGVSILEMSHRSSAFMSVNKGLERDMRTLLQIPENYRVLSMQGGATAQFAAVIYNLVEKGDTEATVDYLVTGTWSKKAAQEATMLLGSSRVNILAQCDKTMNLPAPDLWNPVSKKSKFVYYCENETVDGFNYQLAEWHFDKFAGSVPIVCDMSSSFMSRPVTISNYGVIFAGAQKNVGPAGLTIVIVRDDLLPSTVTGPHIPSIMNYRLMAEHDSLYNTPPVFSMYVVALTLKHLIQTYGSDNDESGGHQSLAKLGEENAKKANLLYRTIDSSQGFYHNPVPQAYRSLMNIVFRIRGGNGVGANFDTDLETTFVKEASQRGLIELKGHRSVGGLRASLYNAMTYENVELLCNFMLQFQQQHQQ